MKLDVPDFPADKLKLVTKKEMKRFVQQMQVDHNRCPINFWLGSKWVGWQFWISEKTVACKNTSYRSSFFKTPKWMQRVKTETDAILAKKGTITHSELMKILP